MYTAITATSQTLSEYLTNELRSDSHLRAFFDPGSGGGMIVSLNSPDEMGELHQEGVSLWLYRVARDEDRLNAPPLRANRAQFHRTPLPVRLHYLVTPLVDRTTPTGSALEQTVLGKLLLLFHDRPQFSGPALKADLTGDLDVELTVRLEPMSVDDITRIWQALDRSYELSVSYEVTVVAIRSEALDDLPPVEVVQTGIGVIVSREELA
jgi:hypothetical protein